MRDEMFGAVVRRAIEHPEFRQRLVDDPENALRDHGFILEASDMDQLQRLRNDLGSPKAEDKLRDLAQQFGITPQQN